MQLLSHRCDKYVPSGVTDTKSVLHATKLVGFQAPKTTFPKPGTPRGRFSSDLQFQFSHLPWRSTTPTSPGLAPCSLRLMTGLVTWAIAEAPHLPSEAHAQWACSPVYLSIRQEKNTTSYVPQCVVYAGRGQLLSKTEPAMQFACRQLAGFFITFALCFTSHTQIILLTATNVDTSHWTFLLLIKKNLMCLTLILKHNLLKILLYDLDIINSLRINPQSS